MNSKNNSSNVGMIIVVLVIIAAGSFFVLKKYNVFDNNDSKGTVVAKINGKPVYSKEADMQLNVMTRGQGADAEFGSLDDKSKNIILREIAAQKLILEEAYKKGVDKQENIQKAVSAYKDTLVRDEFLKIKASGSVTEESIQAKYKELVKDLEGRTQFKVKHILLKTKKEANEVRKRLSKESFEKLASEKSEDKKTAMLGGDLGYRLSGSMAKEFEDACMDLNVGEISKPVETKFGWHIIKLDEKYPAKPAPFEQVKDAISREILNESIQAYVKSILDKADIKMTEAAPEAETTEKDDIEG